MTEPLLARAWLNAEMDRIWLLAEEELRRLQQLELRPPSHHPQLAELEAVLTERRAARTGKIAAPDAAELARALAAVTARLETLRGPATERLAERLGLTLTDIAGLLLVAAPSIDPPLADLFALVRGPAMARRGVDVALIGHLFSFRRRQRIELLGLLDEQRPPLRCRLIQVAPAQDVYSSASYRSMQPTLDLLWLLTTGGDCASPSVAPTAALVRSQASWQPLLLDDATRAGLEPLACRFAGQARDGLPLPWVVLWGGKGSGKREVASRLAAFAGKPLLTLDCKRVEAAQRADLVRRACRDAAWLDAALYVGPLGSDELHEQAAVVAELERCVQPLLLGFETTAAPRLQTARPIVEHPLPVPPAPTQIQLWQRELGRRPLETETTLATIARGYKLTPGEIIESVREAVALAGEGAIDGAILRRVIERRLRNELGAVATRLTVTTSWDDVILPLEAAARVQELIARKRYEDLVYREWGLDRRIGYGKGLIALFSGPPGTGKTLLAGLIAQELGLELYQVDLSQIFSRWLGEAEKALARVFDQAERAHAVLLFDEADALFAKRTEVEGSHDRYANVGVNYLLQRLERYSGVAVLTTNKDSYLDEALRRRLSLHLQLEEPEVPERLRLWQKHLPAGVPGSDTVDVAAIASDYELAGGYIKNVALRAAFLCAAEEVPLSTEQVRRAAMLELEDMGHVVRWPIGSGGDGLQAEPLDDEMSDYLEG